jgi:hypothetical protein
VVLGLERGPRARLGGRGLHTFIVTMQVSAHDRIWVR